MQRLENGLLIFYQPFFYQKVTRYFSSRLAFYSDLVVHLAHLASVILPANLLRTASNSGCFLRRASFMRGALIRWEELLVIFKDHQVITSQLGIC